MSESSVATSSVSNTTTNNLSPLLFDAVLKNVLLAVVMFSLSLLTSVGNALVLYAVRTEKKLQTVCNMYIVSLATADLIVGTFVMPIAAIYVLTEKWLFGRIFCQMWLSVDYVASTASIFNLLILSLDRFWSVTRPLQYLPKRTRKRAFLFIGFVWLASALWFIPITTWHLITNNGNYTLSINDCNPEYAKNSTFKIVTSFFNFYIPLSIMYGLYGKIFYEIKKRSRQEHLQIKFASVRTQNFRSHDNMLQQSESNNSINFVKYDSSGSGSREIQESNFNKHSPMLHCHQTQLRNLDRSPRLMDNRHHNYFMPLHKRSSPQSCSNEPVTCKRKSSAALYKEIKAARQLGVIMGAFTVCFLPYFIVFVVVAFCPTCVHDNLMNSLTWVGYINSTLNPFLYPLCNQTFRNKFRDMFHGTPFSKVFHQRRPSVLLRRSPNSKSASKTFKNTSPIPYHYG